jgi:hypothetical protein
MFDPFLDNHIASFGRFQLVMYDGWYDHIDDHHDGQDYSPNVGIGHIVEADNTVGTFAFCPHCGILNIHPDDRYCTASGTPIDGTADESSPNSETSSDD